MKAELYPEVAPNTVNNFISLVKKGYYDGLIFHRVISGFMIQGGCPEGTGTGGYNIKGNLHRMVLPNDLAHTEGVLSMARAMHPDSAQARFLSCTRILHIWVWFLCSIRKDYHRHGYLVNKIADTPTDYNDRPLESTEDEKR